jgi:DNA phosphorothioation-dependent restriction protein DptH
MNNLVQTLAGIIKDKIKNSINGRHSERLESRFIFHGPPMDILEPLFIELSSGGGIEISRLEGDSIWLPVLLQLPADYDKAANPQIGVSGKCDENHLLHIRNDPNSSSFVAMMPPGQYNNRSVASTTDEFGVSASSNTEHATFDEWWDDGFIQYLVRRGLEEAGIDKEFIHDATSLIERAASALDEMDKDRVGRVAAWRLISRVYSIRGSTLDLPSDKALALACGTPPTRNGIISAKQQLGVVARIALEMTDGFKTGIDRITNNATLDTHTIMALQSFLMHVQSNCEVPTAFERATQAFYIPTDSFSIKMPPDWWTVLDTECWDELLSEGTDESSGELSITCTNAILPIVRGIPALVRDVIELSVDLGDNEEGLPVDVLLTGGSYGKSVQSIAVIGATSLRDHPPSNGQTTPITYKVVSEGRKTSTAKVISLATWKPGIMVGCRMAKKVTPPRKPRRSRVGADWEASLSLPGSGRYEILLFTSPESTVVSATGVPDDAIEKPDESLQPLNVRELRSGQYQIEIEVDGNYQLEISFLPNGSSKIETCGVYITCEEVKEEGCRSEFERLIRLNRRNLEKIDTKTIVQLERHARCSSLQGWLLDEQNISRSFIPLVLSDDYSDHWAPPDWNGSHGPIMSQGRFLHDPRPETSLFEAPVEFIETRCEIFKRVRQTNEQSGLLESSQLGKWLGRDPDFRSLVERYLDSYMVWLTNNPETACWVDTIAVCPREPDGRTLDRIPDAIILSPLHPLRLAWHCFAQYVLHEELEGDDPRPCPAASILDPSCVPDLLTMSLQSPQGPLGIDRVAYLSVESNTDYWSVLWNGSRLGQIPTKSNKPPFDETFGLVVGGVSTGFSPAQVTRALEDVSDLLSAKPIISLVVSSAGGTTDAFNEGIASWCTRRYGRKEKNSTNHGTGARVLEIFDTRTAVLRPDQAAISNLSEDTDSLVRWFERQPADSNPDLGIIAQLDTTQPASIAVGVRSPLGIGGLIRHRVRRQLQGAFLSESRQGLCMPPSGEILPDKIASCINLIEGTQDEKIGLQFAPNVHAISDMLEKNNANFVAVSSSAIDPACFLGGWIDGTYLWDYDLPSYSNRAGDTSGYYLLSKIREADREALRRVLELLPGCDNLQEEEIKQILLEVARRGIPTVRGLSGDDTGATGDLGMFLAVRLLQDQFRLSGNQESLLPVISGSHIGATIALIVPVDPFRGYLADLSRSLGKEVKDASLSRPDLLVIGIHIHNSVIRLHLTPVEVKCRQGANLSQADSKDALAQAKSLSNLFNSIHARAKTSIAWKLAYQHLILSMVGFGLRVYSQQEAVSKKISNWAEYHESIAAAILSPSLSISIDEKGRLIVVDNSPQSDARDQDSDGFHESIFISIQDAGRMVAGDAQIFYDAVRAKVGNWNLIPKAKNEPSDEEPLVDILTQLPDSSVGLSESYAQDSAVQSGAELNITESLSNLELVPDNSTKAVPLENSNECDGITLAVGSTVDGFEPQQLELNISDTRLNQLNIGVVGDLGTGKTQLLKSLIFQIATAQKANRGVKPRMLIFDYKRDYSSSDFIEATGARVVKPVRLPLNLFETSTLGESVAPWLDRFRFFSDVLDKVYSGIGPVQRDKLKGAVRNAYTSCNAAGREPTIYDIHAEYRDLLAGKSDSPMAIIDDLVDMEIFEQDNSKTMPFDEFLDGIVVISLDALGQDDRTKNMLVAIMLNMFYENMLKTPKRPFIGQAPQLRVIDSYLLVDEADNIMRYEFDVLRKLLLQGREFGTGVILASQYLRHFKVGATDYREPLLSWFIHKVPNATASELGALGFTSDLGDLSERVKTLPNHHCLYKSYDVAGEVIKGLPFFELLRGRTK